MSDIKIIENRIKAASYLLRFSNPSELLLAKELIDNCNSDFLNEVKSKTGANVEVLDILALSIEASTYTKEIGVIIREERIKFEKILVDKLGLIKTRVA